MLRATEGAGVVSIGGNGWTRVDRPASIAANVALQLFDARLTPPSTPTVLAALQGGTALAPNGSIVVPPGALQSGASLSVTAIGSQGLEGALPLGWSPIAAADVAPHGLSLGGGAALSTAGAIPVAPGTSLVLAFWDESAAAWRAVTTVAAGDPAAGLQASIATTGQYAWLLADASPAVPATPADGALVAGVAAVEIPADAVTTVNPQPTILFYKVGAHSDVRGIVATTALPSGTPLQARIIESYAFTSGSEAHPDTLLEDLVSYRAGADAGAVAAGFPVTASLAFDPITLRQGVITVELDAPAAGPRIVSTVSTAGGAVQTPTGEVLQLPAGAAADTVPVQLRGLTAATLGAALPSTLQFVGAVDVSFSGSFTQTATLTVPKPAQITSDGQLLLVRLQEIRGLTSLVFVGTGKISGSHILSDTSITGLDGIRVPGRYAFVQTTAPFGFATGHVRAVDGSQAAGALVTSSSMPIVALSQTTGAYASVVGVGTSTLTAVDLHSNASGSGNVTAANPRDVAPLDIQLIALIPRVTTTVPSDGATGVALGDPVLVGFSEPIDPATVNGANAGNVLLTAPGGSAVPGIISLSANNTTLTLRPTASLASNTAYTLAVGQSIADVSGTPLASAVTAHFTTLNTAPPPPPPAGGITASIPGSDGTTTIVATQGTAGLHDTVSIVNLTTGQSTPVLLDPNGGFRVAVQVGLTDTVQIVITSPSGAQTTVAVPRFTNSNADGSLSAVVTSTGGRVEGPGGVAVDVPDGAFPAGTIVTLKPIAEADFPVQLGADDKQRFPFAGGIQLDFGGQTPQKYVNVFVPAGPNDLPTDQWIVSQVRDNNGQPTLSVVDTAKLIEGRVRTSSPPCPGVTGAGVYSVHKSVREVGLNYGVMYASGYGGLQIRADFPFLGALVMPFGVMEPVSPAPVCYPVLTGHITVSENSQQVEIPAGTLTPEDREIVVTNTTRVSETHFPRNVVEFTFIVPGSATDSFKVVITDAAGATHLVTSFTVTGAAPNVVIHIDPDVVPVSVLSVDVTDLTTHTDTVFPQAQVVVKLKAPGGAGDIYRVSVIDVNGASRDLTNVTIQSPTGAGSLVAHAVDATIDPTAAEIVAANAEIDIWNASHDPQHQKVHVEGAGRARVDFQNMTQGTTVVIPAGSIVNGGFTYTFNGAVTDQYAVAVRYDNGFTDVQQLPNFRITVTNRITGKVIKTIVAQAPPRDQPLNLGPISDDTDPPILTAGPSRMTSFDPNGFLTFTFSEAMDANSLKNGMIVELVKNGVRTRVEGTVRVSAGNTVATFVPTHALSVAAEYSVTFVGGDSLGHFLEPSATAITDRSGNAMGTSRFKLTTFRPRLAGHFAADIDPSTGQKIGIKDIEIRRKTVSNTLHTYLMATADSTSGYRLGVLDVTDPANPTRLGTSIGGSGKKEIHLLPDLGGSLPVLPTRAKFTGCDNLLHNGPFSGDLAVTSSFNTFYSYLSFFDVTDPDNPCLLANKLLTATPDTLTDFSIKGTVHALGFARGLATIQSTTGFAAYVAVTDVGLFASDIGKNIPEYLPAERVKEGLFAGNYWDVVNVNDKLLALNRDDHKLEVFDPNLSLLGSLDLPDQPRRIRTVTGYLVDRDGDGLITPDEQMDLAFVTLDNAATGVNSIQIVDITNLDELKIIGSIPMPGITRDLDIDADKHRLFASGMYVNPVTPSASGGDALYMIDMTNPFQTPVDADGDGLDDRIIWKQPYPAGVYGFRLDRNRGLAYVGSPLGLDLWAHLRQLLRPCRRHDRAGVDPPVGRSRVASGQGEGGAAAGAHGRVDRRRVVRRAVVDAVDSRAGQRRLSVERQFP